ncbi:MAG: alpha-amylase [Lachnospiraceae bacterium]|nr:alpha-amylase [Lachnospiraceae bacterium]
MLKISAEKGDCSKPGVTVTPDGVNIAVESRQGRPVTLELFLKDSLKKAGSVRFPKDSVLGDVYSMKISGFEPEKYAYRIRYGNNEAVDPFATAVTGNERFGKRKMYALFGKPQAVSCGKKPMTPWNESVFYLLNVRGFTRDSSADTDNKGTLKGLTEKIPYLKKLGITAVILQPVYDFDETMEPGISGEKRLNFWGYSRGNYFAVKQAYCSGEPCREFSETVKSFHDAKLEVILQFYFPDDIPESYVTACIRYWVAEYGIDGIQLLGSSLPLRNVFTDPLLKSTKILVTDPDMDRVYGNSAPDRKNAGAMLDSFMYDCRKYLKGDEDMLSAFGRHILNNPEKSAAVNYITNYYGFTLNDLVSFDRKHNESNGEDNKDGGDYNYSWNCGAEGKSRKKAVNILRRRQIRNALCFMFLSQGTPMLRAGDEFLNSQNGNNNAYCQDNKTSYLNWNDLEKNRDIHDYICRLIAFRKEHPVFRSASRKKMMDYISCGYPDVSFHGEQAWHADFANYNRHFAVMYCGAYEKNAKGGRDDDFFVIYNMHWMNHRFHPPKPPKNKVWKIVMSTTEGFCRTPIPVEDGEVIVQNRSIMLLQSFATEGRKE